MLVLPLSFPQKVGVVLYGFAAGLAVAIGTSVVACSIGLALALIDDRTGLIHLGELRPWLPLAGLLYGFGIGCLIGLVVWWRVCASRLRTEANNCSLTGD